MNDFEFKLVQEEAQNGIFLNLFSSDVDCVVFGLSNAATTDALSFEFNAVSNGALARLIEAGDFDGRLESTCMLRQVSGVRPYRILLVGLGNGELHTSSYRKVCAAAAKALAKEKKISTVSWALTANAGEGLAGEQGWRLATSVLALQEARYSFFARFPYLKNYKNEDAMPLSPEQCVISLLVQEKIGAKEKSDFSQAIATANGEGICRDLGNLPPNICTPTYVASAARKIAENFSIRTKILDKTEIIETGMNCFLAVAEGSKEAPKFIVMEYSGGMPGEAPIVLVGKGITFDSGGISLKPGEAMDEMKFDMCGAAAVMGTIRAAAEMSLKLNVVAVIPACENMPGNGAVRPGDVVKTMDGLTVEVLNTDAEGRLILCDALTYAGRYSPRIVIDVATLTGAMAMFLGSVRSGLFANDDELAAILETAGNISGDLTWRIPMDSEYGEELKSNFADMANVGGRAGSAISAAIFLGKFAERFKWAHLDIAGVAWTKSPTKGATGRPVRLLTQFLTEYAKQAPNSAVLDGDVSVPRQVHRNH